MSTNGTDQTQASSGGGFQLWYLNHLVVNMVWPGILPILLPTYVLQITGSAGDAGVVMGLIGMSALTAPLWARFADQYRAHRSAQSIGLVLMAAGILLLGFAQEDFYFIMGAAMIGIGAAPLGMVNTVYVVGAGLSEEAEAKGLAWLNRLLILGQVVGGFLIAGLLEAEVPFTLMFLVTAGVAFVALLLVLFATSGVAARVAAQIEQRQKAAAEAATAEAGKFGLRDIFGSTFGLVVIMVFLSHLGWTGVSGQYVNYFDGAFGIERSVTSAVNSMALLISLLVIGPFGKWMGRSGPMALANVGIAGRIGLGLALLALPALLGGPALLWLPLVIWIVFRLINPMVELSNPTLIARTSPVSVAQAQGFMVVAYALAISVGNMLAGGLAESFGWAILPWQTIIGCGLALAVALFGIAPRLQPGPREPQPEMLRAAIAMEDFE